MSSDLKNARNLNPEFLKELPQIVTRLMKNALSIIAQDAAFNEMIPTSSNIASKFASIGSPVNPDRLTWRSGALARSLTRTDDPYNITEVKSAGTIFSGIIGTRIPYAAIHEFGGTIPAHTINITDDMRRYFWHKWYESEKTEEKWKFAAVKKGPIQIPDIIMRARPFLAPAFANPDVIGSIRSMFLSAFPEEIASIMRTALSVGTVSR